MATNLSVDNFTITELLSFTAFDIEDTTKLCFQLDQLQSLDIQNSEETSDVTGASGRKLDKLKRNKSVTITGTNGLVSAGLIETQTGGTYEYIAEEEVSVEDTLTLTDPTMAVLTRPAVGLPGFEIRTVVLETAGGMLDTTRQLKQGAVAENGTFTFDPLTGALGFAEGEFNEGDRIRVFYTTTYPVARVDNPADTYSKQCFALIDCEVRDICGKTYHGQFRIPKCDMTGNFGITLGGEQAVHNFEAEALASVGTCDTNTSGRKNMYWDFIVFGITDTPAETPVQPTPPAENPDENEDPVNNEPEVPAPGDNTALAAALDSYESVLEDGRLTISEDGTDVAPNQKWVTEEQAETFTTAWNTADAVRDDDGATQSEIDAALIALQAAALTLLNGAQNGTNE